MAMIPGNPFICKYKQARHMHTHASHSLHVVIVVLLLLLLCRYLSKAIAIAAAHNENWKKSKQKYNHTSYYLLETFGVVITPNYLKNHKAKVEQAIFSVLKTQDAEPTADVITSLTVRTSCMQ
jgi:hypothetical protein